VDIRIGRRSLVVGYWLFCRCSSGNNSRSFASLRSSSSHFSPATGELDCH
jgi:hypothetical protein